MKSQVIEEILLLLDLFEASVSDVDSNRLVWKFCNEKHRWVKAHGLFSTIRDRTVKAEKDGNKVKEAQYLFEESVAKLLHNLTNSTAPFDADSPYWIIKNALALARELDIAEQSVIDIVA